MLFIVVFFNVSFMYILIYLSVFFTVIQIILVVKGFCFTKKKQKLYFKKGTINITSETI